MIFWDSHSGLVRGRETAWDGHSHPWTPTGQQRIWDSHTRLIWGMELAWDSRSGQSRVVVVVVGDSHSGRRRVRVEVVCAGWSLVGSW